MAYTTIDDPSKYFQAKIYTGNATDDTALQMMVTQIYNLIFYG